MSAAAGVTSPARDQRGTWVANTITSVRRYWWIVSTIVCLALVGGFVSTATTPPAYTGRTSLIVSSSDRSPDQDAVLVQGYVVYFDDLPYQRKLLAEAGVSGKITLSAAAAAASPILVVSATTDDRESAQSAAVAVATAFKDDINRTRDQRVAADLASLQDQLDTALGRSGTSNQALVSTLQEQIRELHADRDDVLQGLQSRGGVVVQPPSFLINVGLSLVGGLLLGVLAALMLAALSPRLRSWHDVENKVGLNTLTELPGLGSTDDRARRQQLLEQLANRLRIRLAGPGVVAITKATEGDETQVVAEALATEWATQGYQTVLVRLGRGKMSPPSQDVVRGTELAENAVVTAAPTWLRAGPVADMSILDLRSPEVDGVAAFPQMKLTDMLRLEPLDGAFVVLETPALLGSVDAQAASIAADVTILVIDRSAMLTQVREAVRFLRQSGVDLLGAVLMPPVADAAGRAGPRRRANEGTPSQALGQFRASSTASGKWSWWPTSNLPSESSHPARALSEVPPERNTARSEFDQPRGSNGLQPS